jgi:ribonuclease P/MRP protein subunit POP1
MNRQPPKGQDARKRKDPPSSGGNGPNRQGKNASENNAKTNKRAKMQDARTIRTQPSDAALKDGELDLQAFLSAREFEIRALEASMKKSKAASTTRAFQKVPRGVRRRTASHNVKRVPKRLRARAAKEMAEDNTPTVEARKRRPRTTRARIRAETAKKLRFLAERKRKRKAKVDANGVPGEGQERVNVAGELIVRTRQARPKIRRNTLNEPPAPKSKFRKRQMNKTWLPTHMWHAKRARMTEPKEPLWRFAIPLTPTEKCYRPTHRAAGDKGVVVWDTSYMSTIGVYGSTEGIARVLQALGLPKLVLTGQRYQKWRSGLRKWTGMLSKERKEGRKEICPATIVWNPEKGPGNTAEGEGKLDDHQKPQRQVFIRAHPSCFFELFNELLKLVKMQTPQLYIEDLRFEIGSIELTGPASTEALLSILHPYYSEAASEESHATVFRSLVGVTNPASLPPDALLGFSIMDPRLKHPPKRVQMENDETSLLDTLTQWPVGNDSKSYALFDRDIRFQAGVLPSQKSLDRRKGSAVPGTELAITEADPPIPIMLLASRPASGGHAQGTWTVLAPWKCILPIWHNLVKVPLSTGGNPRLGGLNEVQQVAFEQGGPWFPGDFPATDAGAEWELEQRAKRRADYARRPKSKRVAWESLDLGAGRKGEVGDGLACDYECLFGLPKDEPEAKKVDEEPVYIDAERMEVDVAEGATDKKQQPPQQLSRESLLQIHHLSKPAFTALLTTKTPSSSPPPHSLVTVNITLTGRGVAKPCARIYRLPTHNPITVLPSTQAEVPATQSQPADPASASLPTDLREQWLSRLNTSDVNQNHLPQPYRPPPRRIPADADMATRKRLVAESLLNPVNPIPFSWEMPAANERDVGGHPLCPGEEDLIGFVTTGAYCLTDGKGKAIGSLSVEKTVEAVKLAREKGEKGQGALCVVRNAGESVGWLARWEVV